jgi:hypothetical protein
VHPDVAECARGGLAGFVRRCAVRHVAFDLAREMQRELLIDVSLRRGRSRDGAHPTEKAMPHVIDRRVM